MSCLQFRIYFARCKREIILWSWYYNSVCEKTSSNKKMSLFWIDAHNVFLFNFFFFSKIVIIILWLLSIMVTVGFIQIFFSFSTFLVLDVDAFERLLGPCMNIMKRNIEDYENQLVKIFGSKQNMTDVRWTVVVCSGYNKIVLYNKHL